MAPGREFSRRLLVDFAGYAGPPQTGRSLPSLSRSSGNEDVFQNPRWIVPGIVFGGGRIPRLRRGRRHSQVPGQPARSQGGGNPGAGGQGQDHFQHALQRMSSRQQDRTTYRQSAAGSAGRIRPGVLPEPDPRQERGHRILDRRGNRLPASHRHPPGRSIHAAVDAETAAHR